MKKIKALIIDDEALGRKIIHEYLKSHSEVEPLAECQDAYEALEAIEKYHPDLLFLDVQMPEINGFEMLKMLEEIPFIIFSTAYDQYALKAFEVNAVDYLLKPFDQERFDIALERAKERISPKRGKPEEIKNLLKQLHSENPYLDKIMVKKSGKIFVLDVNEIDWLEAAGDYVNLHTAKGSFLVLQSLSHIETRLNPARFVRVHRSAIVSIGAIKEIVPWSKGRLKIHLRDGHQTLISRSGTKRIKKFMI
jgi:two-component system LytT family response regulator